ncbi:MAG: hypothetical protein WAM92_07835, partial [Mycobacterium sp.]
MKSAAIASRLARYIAVPVVSVGVIAGAALGLAATATANPSFGPWVNHTTGPRTPTAPATRGPVQRAPQA